MNHMVIAAIILANVFNLSVAIMARCNNIGGPGGCDLVELGPAIGTPLIREPGLKCAPAAAAAKIIVAVGHGIDEVFLAHHGFNHKPQLIYDLVGSTFSSDIAGILNREFGAYFSVPVGVDL